QRRAADRVAGNGSVHDPHSRGAAACRVTSLVDLAKPVFAETLEQTIRADRLTHQGGLYRSALGQREVARPPCRATLRPPSTNHRGFDGRISTRLASARVLVRTRSSTTSATSSAVNFQSACAEPMKLNAVFTE